MTLMVTAWMAPVLVLLCVLDADTGEWVVLAHLTQTITPPVPVDSLHRARLKTDLGVGDSEEEMLPEETSDAVAEVKTIVGTRLMTKITILDVELSLEEGVGSEDPRETQFLLKQTEKTNTSHAHKETTVITTEINEKRILQ